tara:strand:+ start:245 stop:904 length:660 start_codon:yes stop_codon:yes gene_type:complete
MSENINNQYDFFKKVNLDSEGNIGVSVIGGGASKPFSFTSDNYTALSSLTGMSDGDLAYIVNSEGTQWLPGTIGGNYYPNGIYIYTSSSWTSDRNAVSYELHLDDERLDSLEDKLRTNNNTTTTTSLIPNIDLYNQESISLLSSALTIAAPTGTPSTGMKLIIRLTDNGTNRALTWDNIYRVIGVTLPTTTTADKILYIGCIYNESASKWDVVAIKEEV